MSQHVRSFGSVGMLSILVGTPSTGCRTISSATGQAWLQAINTPSHTRAMVSVIRLEIFKSIGRQIKICWVQGLMMRFWVVLGEVIGFVGSTQSPKDVILALVDTITDPIELHVNGLGPFLFDVVIGNAGGSGVVSLNRGGRLGMS